MYLLDDFGQRLVSFYILEIELVFISLTFEDSRHLRVAQPAIGPFLEIIFHFNRVKLMMYIIYTGGPHKVAIIIIIGTKYACNLGSKKG